MSLKFKDLVLVVSKRYNLDITTSYETVKSCEFVKLNLKNVQEFVEHLNFLESKEVK